MDWPASIAALSTALNIRYLLGFTNQKLCLAIELLTGRKDAGDDTRELLLKSSRLASTSSMGCIPDKLSEQFALTVTSYATVCLLYRFDVIENLDKSLIVHTT
jgi:hypothetical protein